GCCPSMADGGDLHPVGRIEVGGDLDVFCGRFLSVSHSSEGFERDSSPVRFLSPGRVPMEGSSEFPADDDRALCGGSGICYMIDGVGGPVDGVPFDGGLCEAGDVGGVVSATDTPGISSRMLPEGCVAVGSSHSSSAEYDGQSSQIAVADGQSSKVAITGTVLGSRVPIVSQAVKQMGSPLKGGGAKGKG
ncbi:hypothetical protein Dimus_003469, partial [Dionaea muscipula]